MMTLELVSSYSWFGLRKFFFEFFSVSVERITFDRTMVREDKVKLEQIKENIERNITNLEISTTNSFFFFLFLVLTLSTLGLNSAPWYLFSVFFYKKKEKRNKHMLHPKKHALDLSLMYNSENSPTWKFGLV